MKKRNIIFLATSAVLLSGCINREKELVQNVEETATSPEIITEAATTIDTSNPEIFGTEYVSYFVDDSHFFDAETLDYSSTLQQSVGTNIKISNVFSSDNIADSGTYFVQEQSSLEESLNSILKINGKSRNEYTYLFMTAEITNISSVALSFCVIDLRICSRVADDSMVKYGLADHRINLNDTAACLWDYQEQDSDKKDYYMATINAGESIITTIVNIIPKKMLTEELYLKLGETPIGNHDQKTNTWKPNDSKDLKFLKLHLN